MLTAERKARLLLFSTVALSLVLNGCFRLQQGAGPRHFTPPADFRLELRLAHGFVGGAQYEHYKLAGNTLYAECGALRRSRNLPRSQSFNKLKTGDLQQVFDAALAAGGQAEASGSLPAPGRLKGFTDPGQLSLRLFSGGRQLDLNTSLDALQNPSEITAALITLIVSLRQAAVRSATAGPVCGLEPFFGVGSRLNELEY